MRCEGKDGVDLMVALLLTGSAVTFLMSVIIHAEFTSWHTSGSKIILSY